MNEYLIKYYIIIKMTIFYALVVKKRDIVLAEYAEFTGNF